MSIPQKTVKPAFGPIKKPPCRFAPHILLGHNNLTGEAIVRMEHPGGDLAVSLSPANLVVIAQTMLAQAMVLDTSITVDNITQSLEELRQKAGIAHASAHKQHGKRKGH